ncbi:MAG TPA: radical SAM protein [Methanoregulaceae archaeon]|nr:radical SAM protein [Methanoregulaceae archaeon]
MQWIRLKEEALAAGGCRVVGRLPEHAMADSTAGPGAGGRGAVFFSIGQGRVRLPIADEAPLTLVAYPDGRGVLHCGGEEIEGRIEPVGLHCPRQAFITVSPVCRYRCRYCSVPLREGRRRSIEECVDLVSKVRARIDAIALTSGILESIEEESDYVCRVVRALTEFGLPIGVSIFPAADTPERLHALGVREVKFNLETSTPALFEQHCPGLPYDAVLDALASSVTLFGRGRVFSNVIVGLGDSWDELSGCIDLLVGMGVVPVLRPLNPVAGCIGYGRPGTVLLDRAARHLQARLREAGFDGGGALTMCGACTGCDIAPWRDL